MSAASESSERIAVRLSEVLLVAVIVYLAIHVEEARAWCYGIMGLIIGSRTGAGIATRVADQTARRVRGESNAPPPDDGPPPPLDVSDAPPPPPPRRSGGRFFTLAGVGLLAAASARCSPAQAPREPTPRELLFAADVNACVDKAKAACGEDRACGRASYERCRTETTARYGVDGGPRDGDD